MGMYWEWDQRRTIDLVICAHCSLSDTGCEDGRVNRVQSWGDGQSGCPFRPNL